MSFLSNINKSKLKKIMLVGLNYLPGAIMLVFALYALSASLVMVQENANLQEILQQNITVTPFEQHKIEMIKERVSKEEGVLYWSIWGLGLMGFVLVLLNANKLSRLDVANAEKAETVKLLEKQLAEIKRGEKEKNALQEQLFQAQKLEAIGRLAGGIAHDFNNILAAMNGYAEFLTDDLDETSPQHGFAQNILKAGVQARHLIEQVLAFSRRDGDEVQTLNLKTPIDETVTMLKASLPKSVDLKVDIQETGSFITGNPTALSQGIMNLCVNAKDAMENEKGTLQIGLYNVTPDVFAGWDLADTLPDPKEALLLNIEDVKKNHTKLTLSRLAKDQGYVCLSVSDNGSGMPRVVLEHIFEPFFTTKDVNKGTGLGMAMVHGLIATHRGAMVVNTIVGKGTRFDLYFPVVSTLENQVEAAIEIKEQKSGGGTVLVVDDQPEVRHMLTTMIERMGYDVEACENGFDAIEILREHPTYFDVVITDHNMPKMTGLELAQEVSLTNPDIPFIVVTGYALESFKEMMRDHNSIRHILNKPVDRYKLGDALNEIVSSRKLAV